MADATGRTTSLRRELFPHQVTIGLSYRAHDTREGNADSTEVALHSLRERLATWAPL